MDNFWKWLKKANARAVFFCLLLALTGAAAWWAWKLLTPIRVASPAASGTTGEQAGPGLGILSYLDAQRAVGTNRVANLFTPPEVLAPLSRKPHEKTDPPRAQAHPEKNLKAPDKPAPAPIKEVVTLTYRGMYVRGDGVTMALISDSKSRQTAFYAAGTNLFGLKLEAIEPETLAVNLADQTSAKLKRGVPQSFPEGNHAD